MEIENPVDEQAPKKGRHRKKLLYNSILQTMEFYFSDSNLAKDRYLSQIIQDDPYVALDTFLHFNKIRKLTMNIEDIKKALNKSTTLELSDNKTKVRRKGPVKIKENVEDCTIYVERIKADATHDFLSMIFSEFGNVVYVSIPKYKHSKLNKGFAFVEFDNVNEAKSTLEFFEGIGCKMSSQMSPEDLCSITTYEGDDAVGNDCLVGNKRKCDDDSGNETKKLKTDDKEDNGVIDDDDKKKKKAKKTKKKVNFKELGLHILSKSEWKKMRNRYLDMQRKKMKQLKQFLNKRRDTQNVQKEVEVVDNKLEFVPNVIVKILLPEPCFDIKKKKIDLKSYSEQIKYIDFPMPSGSEEVFLRFSDNESAEKFRQGEFGGKCVLLSGEEEKLYWWKIKQDRGTKFKKDLKKQRGRDKLLKKAEKELGKHIRFDDAD